MRVVLAVVLCADIPAYYLVFHRQVTECVPFQGSVARGIFIAAFEAVLVPITLILYAC